MLAYTRSLNGKHMRRHLASLYCILLLSANIPLALAQSVPRIYPAAPTSADNIVFSFGVFTCPPRVPLKDWYRVAVNGNKIRVTLGALGVAPGGAILCPSAPPGVVMYADLGRLPAGTYLFDFAQESPDGTITTYAPNIPVTVTDARALKVAPFVTLNYSGHWWDPADPGWGLFIWQDEKDNLLAAWFTYGDDGKPVWYTIQSGSWKGPSYYEGLLVATNRPGVNNTVKNTTVVAVPIGTAILAFGSFTNGDSHGEEGQFTYTRDGVTQSKRIRRFKP